MIRQIFYDLQENDSQTEEEAVNTIYDLVNFYDDGSPVHDINGEILPPITHDEIKQEIKELFTDISDRLN